LKQTLARNITERSDKMQKMTLKALRANSGLSQESAAKKLGVAAATLSKWENAKSFPDAIEIGRIEELYNTSYNDIIFSPRKKV
jgi:transcriptional regulator with XRE-family HTH domain